MATYQVETEDGAVYEIETEDQKPGMMANLKQGLATAQGVVGQSLPALMQAGVQKGADVAGETIATKLASEGLNFNPANNRPNMKVDPRVAAGIGTAVQMAPDIAMAAGMPGAGIDEAVAGLQKGYTGAGSKLFSGMKNKFADIRKTYNYPTKDIAVAKGKELKGISERRSLGIAEDEAAIPVKSAAEVVKLRQIKDGAKKVLENIEKKNDFGVDLTFQKPSKEFIAKTENVDKLRNMLQDHIGDLEKPLNANLGPKALLKAQEVRKIAQAAFKNGTAQKLTATEQETLVNVMNRNTEEVAANLPDVYGENIRIHRTADSGIKNAPKGIKSAKNKIKQERVVAARDAQGRKDQANELLMQAAQRDQMMGKFKTAGYAAGGLATGGAVMDALRRLGGR